MNNTTIIKCSHCGNDVVKSIYEVTRALKIGRPMYCSLSCGAKHAAKKRNLKALNVNEYNSSPKKCKSCGRVLSYGKRRNDFCSRSCAAVLNNSLVKKRECRVFNPTSNTYVLKPFPTCLLCGSACRTRKAKFCSTSCCVEYKETQRRHLIESGNNQSHSTIRSYLIDKRGDKCELCGWNRVNPKTGKVPIEMEHVDGNHENNKLENLKLLCPNCHSLTPTYKGLNRGHGRASRMARYNSGKSY